MNRTLKWIVGTIAGAGILGLLVFAFLEGRAELEREREREKPIKLPPRISRTPEGNLIVTVDLETQKRIALETATVAASSAAPEVAAYGRLQEDPGSSFVVRSPIAGTLRPVPARDWPALGEVLSDMSAIGVVEPRLAPIERVDLVTRLSDAHADVEAAEARLNAARTAYERARALNADNKNISDRAVQEAESVMKGEEARLAAARRNVAEFDAAASRQSVGTTEVPLVTTKGGEVVELLARPNEAIESGQPILRVARFDHLLARVDVPVGETIDPRLTSARIVAVGHEDQPITGQRVSVASSVDPATLGEGFLFRLSGAAPWLRPGAAVVAYLRAPGAAAQAVLVPNSAVIRFAGKTWVYRQIADDKFSRREISSLRTNEQGFLVTQALTGGDRVVTSGAQLLLSEEQKSQIQILEEEESK